MAELPSGTVSFLFTDLEVSTRLWEREPEAMRAALARHDRILRDAVERHDGQVVKGTGDGIHAVFATADSAVAAAVDAQVAMGAQSWELGEPPRVRMGIHTGVAELRDGDYFGSPVNRAARLMGLAHGGQILVSHAVEELVRDSLASEVDFLDLGEHALRDLERPERIFQVCHRGLVVEFAPLQTGALTRSRLPVALTSFVGRERELAGLVQRLGESRLVTVIGAGGVGKTRVALQTAAEIVPRFEDGVWCCELAAAEHGDAMTEVVATALGVRARPGVSVEDSVVETLRPKHLLVVLDNCEHLLRSVARLAGRLLRECPRVWILATSREGLGVAGEQLWPLASLAVPKPSDLESVQACESVRLFEDRARAARPGFALGPSNEAAVAEICRRLDGIPLAIELAAARVAVMTPADIGGLLDERFRLLTGGRHSEVERHQTLRSTVDWSYSLLEENSRVVFDRLGVFTGSFDATAAQAVVAGGGIAEWDVLDALGDLVAKSMVLADDSVDGPMRYRLLETLRAYARGRLEELGEIDEWRRRHARRYADWLEVAGPEMRGPNEIAARRKIGEAFDDLRAALLWSLDRDDDEDAEFAFRMLAATVVGGQTVTVFGEGAERAASSAKLSASPHRLAVFGAAAVWAAWYGGDRAASTAYATAIVDDETASSSDLTIALAVLCYHAMKTGRLDELRRLVVDGWNRILEIATTDLARVESFSLVVIWPPVYGDFATAEAHVDTYVALARRVGNPTLLCMAMWSAGLTLERSDPDGALAAFEEAAALVRLGANDVNLGGILARIARQRDRRGDHIGALDALREALDHFHRIGIRPEIVVALAQLSRTLIGLHRDESATVIAGIVARGPLADMAKSDTPDRIAKTTAKARERLGSDAYNTSFARGAAMTIDNALVFARTELDAATNALVSDKTRVPPPRPDAMIVATEPSDEPAQRRQVFGGGT